MPSTYQSPLIERYASPQMAELFSPETRIRTWRKLWILLAKKQQQLGLPIEDAQIAEMEEQVDNIDFERVREIERVTRHDVMAHIKAFGELCPNAKKIIHLGATSCFVTDNADLLLFRQALEKVEQKLLQLLQALGSEARNKATMPCLAYTHLQVAQPTTVGKRIALWTQDFLTDYRDIQRRRRELRFLGAKGATGTQASFLTLFDGNASQVDALDRGLADALGFQSLTIAGQTYPRKSDAQILDALAGLASSAHKMTTDLRLLAQMGEFAEPWRETKEGGQVGSSAMPYKRNPMLSERCCSLARFLIALSDNGRYTAALQWFERTLDDSANRRLSMPEAFLCADAILNLLTTIVRGWQFYPAVIRRRLEEQLPFLATEEILMRGVQQGGDRQQLHEVLRCHSRAVDEQLREHGGDNDLLQRLAEDEQLPLDRNELEDLLAMERFVGLAPRQVESFLDDELGPILNAASQTAVDTTVEV